MRVLGVIPARGGSKGIRKKNIVDICGKPLIAYSIDAASRSQTLSTFIVSTDSDEIADVAIRYGALAPFRRPSGISNDIASSFDVIMHALAFMEAESNVIYDAVMLLQPTTPMLTAATIDAAILQLSNCDCDSVVSVVDVGANHPYRMYELDDKNTLVGLLAN
jgi:CMP-N,N'-diacetyllegionaminic acid synthase